MFDPRAHGIRVIKRRSLGKEFRLAKQGYLFMSASLSYPGTALKASAKGRSHILILEPDLAVLDYLRMTLVD
ncbi:MAG: hypothetical protein ABI072_02470, partial [Edaphobacter sp.]